MKNHRVFVEWTDKNRPGWGGFISSLHPDFQATFAEMVEILGPPTLVEFRAHDQGWVVQPEVEFSREPIKPPAGPTPCLACARLASYNRVCKTHARRVETDDLPVTGRCANIRFRQRMPGRLARAIRMRDTPPPRSSRPRYVEDEPPLAEAG